MIGVMTAPLPNVVGLAQAAKITGRSESTIRRKRSELEQLGATTGPSGWQIPIEALVHIWNIDISTAGVPLTPPLIAGVSSDVIALQQQLRETQIRADRERARADEAERLAQERQGHIDDLRMSLRMLEAPAILRPAPVPEGVSQAVARRRWWQRRI